MGANRFKKGSGKSEWDKLSNEDNVFLKLLVFGAPATGSRAALPPEGDRPLP